jgi:hypothetical protein
MFCITTLLVQSVLFDINLAIIIIASQVNLYELCVLDKHTHCDAVDSFRNVTVHTSLLIGTCFFESSIHILGDLLNYLGRHLLCITL